MTGISRDTCRDITRTDSVTTFAHTTSAGRTAQDDADWLRRVAYHEAGHAFALWTGQLGFQRISIVPDSDSDGASAGHCLGNPDPTWFDPDAAQRSVAVEGRLTRYALAALAGAAAERHYCGGEAQVDNEVDRRVAIEYADCLNGGPEETDAYLAWLLLRAEGVVASPRATAAIPALAAALLDRRTLSYRRAVAVMRQGIQRAFGLASPEIAPHDQE
ncbi:MAG TPA: hypothetical protein VFW17_16845 [Ktedonobacterales bacterium]|nr:hypothetical protein [Ktedonobacterales bacterium]